MREIPNQRSGDFIRALDESASIKQDADVMIDLTEIVKPNGTIAHPRKAPNRERWLRHNTSIEIFERG
jgi:hypothetical protein